MSEPLQALRSSVARLRRFVESLDAQQLRAPAYPSEWSVADVLGHVGSAAVILQTRLNASRSGGDVPDEFPQPIWDEWNAKSPDQKARDALDTDRALLDAIDAIPQEEREQFVLEFPPLRLDFAGFVSIRLNEHALHTWDVEVAFDPAATIPIETATAVIDHLDLIVKYTGKPSGAPCEVHIRTADPRRDFTLAVGDESVTLEPCPTDHAPDLELPAESLVRLVYGRLDPDHTPAVSGTVDLGDVRPMFPGP